MQATDIHRLIWESRCGLAEPSWTRTVAIGRRNVCGGCVSWFREMRGGTTALRSALYSNPSWRHDMRAGNIVAFVAAVSTLFIYPARPQFDLQGTPPLLAQPPNQGACPPDARLGARSATV